MPFHPSWFDDGLLIHAPLTQANPESGIVKNLANGPDGVMANFAGTEWGTGESPLGVALHANDPTDINQSVSFNVPDATFTRGITMCGWYWYNSSSPNFQSAMFGTDVTDTSQRFAKNNFGRDQIFGRDTGDFIQTGVRINLNTHQFWSGRIESINPANNYGEIRMDNVITASKSTFDDPAGYGIKNWHMSRNQTPTGGSLKGRYGGLWCLWERYLPTDQFEALFDYGK